MSDFDENDIIPEAQQATSDFDEADVVADSIPVDAPEAPQSSAVDQLEEGLASSATGGGIGFGLGKAAQAGRFIADKASTGIGNLDKEQMDYITANADKYKAAPSLDQKLNEFRDLAGRTRQAGFDFKDQALQSLEGAPAVPKQDYLKSIAEVTGKQDYSLPLGENVKNEVFQSAMAEVQPDIEAGQSKLTDIDKRISEIEVNKPNRDVRLQASQQAKIAKAEIKLKRIDEKIATATEKAQQTAINRREDFLANQEIDKNKTNFVQTDKNLKKFNDQLEELNKLKAEKAKIAGDIQKNIEKANKKAKETVRSKAGIPQSLVEIAPDLGDKKLLPQVQGSLQSALGIAEDVDQIPAMSVAKGVIPALREGNKFPMTGAGFSEKFDTDISEQVRSDFGDRFKDYDTNMLKSRDAIKAEEAFLAAGGKVDENLPKGQQIILPESSRQKLAKVAASGADKFVDEKAALQALPQQLSNIGLAQPNQDILGDLKTSALKQGVKDSSVFDMSGYDVANMTKPTGLIKSAKDNFGTKAQETLALFRASKAGQIADKAIDMAPKALGAAGLVLGGASAFADEDVTSAVPGLDQAESAGVPAAAEKSNLREYQALKKYQNSKASQDAAKVGFKQFDKMTSDDLNGLSQKVLAHPSEAARNYAGPLEKAANAKDERSKSAIMWGLYQQPAFRQIYKDINPEGEVEE